VAELRIEDVLGPMRAAGLSDAEIIQVLHGRLAPKLAEPGKLAAEIQAFREPALPDGAVLLQPATQPAVQYEGEPAPGSVWCDPNGGVWTRDLTDGLWRAGSDADGRPEAGTTWGVVAAQTDAAGRTGGRLVSTPPPAYDGPVASTSATVDMPVQYAKERKDGRPVGLETVTETVTITQLARG